MSKEKTVMLLSGNEAFARGVLEAGVDVAAAYPGTPSTEIMETIARFGKETGMHAEWSINEKVAFEVALGASWSGLRSFTAAKHVGLNVAADPFFTAALFGGMKGGFVMVIADDPSFHSSQNEQDTRMYALAAHAICMEPSTPQEALDMIKFAYDFSEKWESLVILRSTTRLSHSRGPVELGAIPKKESHKGEFIKNPTQFVCLPANARRTKPLLMEKLEKIKEYSNTSEWNVLEKGDKSLLIIASGVSYEYVKDAIQELDLKPTVYKIGFSNPLPEGKIIELLKEYPKCLIVEEVEPYLELNVKALAAENNIQVQIFGRKEKVIPISNELNPKIVKQAITQVLNLKKAETEEASLPTNAEINEKLPNRPPELCAGCPHRATFFAIKQAAKKRKLDPIMPGDIGCYTLGFMPPLSAVDTTVAMGASIGIANGIAQATNQVVIPVIGDSTFFHTGIPALINAIVNNAKFVCVIVDNQLTAMTGGQPTPELGKTAFGEPAGVVPLEQVCKGLGIKNVEVVDPYDLEKTTEVIGKAIDSGELSVVIARRDCALEYTRQVKRAKQKLDTYFVDEDLCTGCRICVRTFACPAITFDYDKKKAHVDESMCMGCGVCRIVCPYDAFIKR
ncbi:MAG: indolepyruvate ferredoxin oxidoreductase subunit alpha [Candidatus Heimdallarchaeota archaeon]|nr:indolepyruvate ferredoxin oxidoreductase subunit alpha [Candidatus Heimdallarchaeota archaeon]